MPKLIDKLKKIFPNVKLKEMESGKVWLSCETPTKLEGPITSENQIPVLERILKGGTK